MAAATAEPVVETTTMTLPQMVDIAINSGEAGLINFNLLHALFHIILQQVDLTGTQVEFRGADGTRLRNFVSSLPKTAPKLTLTEFAVQDDKTAKAKAPTAGEKKIVAAPIEATTQKAKVETVHVKGQDIQLTEKIKREISKQEVTKEKQLKIIKRRKTSKEEIIAEPEALKSVSPSEYSLDKLILVEQTGHELPQYSVALTKEQFDNFKKEIADLRTKVSELIDMPNNMALIDAMRKGGDDQSPLIDLFQILTLSKRVDAAEIGMEKLASMMTELAKGLTEGMIDLSQLPQPSQDDPRRGASGTTLKQLNERVDEIERVLAIKDEGGSETKRRMSKPKKSDASVDNEAEMEDKGTLTTDLLDRLEHMPVKKAMSIIQKELIEIKQLLELNNFTQLLKDIEDLKDRLSSSQGEISEVKINKLESKLSELQDQLNSLDTMYNHQMNELQQHLQEVETELAATLEKINMGFPGGDAGGSGEHSVLELHEKFMQLQDVVNSFADTLEQMMQDKSNRDGDLNAMLEQIELLKTVKADKEDLEDALGDKADACMVNRKVSYSQFNATFDDLSKGIEEAISKLSQQEMLWKSALNDIQTEMERKVNRHDLSPLRDFINERLKNLQDKFKTLTALKQEHEAAGTKSKYLRNVNCISCDKDVVMRKEMDQSLMPQPPALPPTRNMGPYLAYELDQLRKQQKCLPKGKNLNYIENALASKKSKDEKDHLCNRYCGGSHTVTTPQQRVTRIGHFLQQYGPEITPVNETMIKGADGHMYKSRDAPAECPANKDDITVQKDYAKPAEEISKPPSKTRDSVSKETGDKAAGDATSKSKQEVVGGADEPPEPTKLPSKIKSATKESAEAIKRQMSKAISKDIVGEAVKQASGMKQMSRESMTAGMEPVEVTKTKSRLKSSSRDVMQDAAEPGEIAKTVSVTKPASKEAEIAEETELVKTSSKVKSQSKEVIAGDRGNVSFANLEPPVKDTEE